MLHVQQITCSGHSYPTFTSHHEYDSFINVATVTALFTPQEHLCEAEAACTQFFPSFTDSGFLAEILVHE